MTTKDDNIAQLETAYSEFRARIAGLPAEAYAEEWLGEWNLSELLAHMSGWFQAMATGLERVGRGERPVPEGTDYSDVEAWNATFAANVQPGPASLEGWDAAFRAYAEAARMLPDDLFGEKDGRPRIASRLLDGAGIHHFGEHGPQVDAWLAARR